MARRLRKNVWSRSLQRTLSSLTRSVLRAGSTAMQQSLRSAAPSRQATVARRPSPPSDNWSSGIAIGTTGPRRYRLYKPPGVRRDERLPLLVMLHGCRQDGAGLAASSRMNLIAARKRFFVLYPEQDRLANVQACWNWYETRSGRAQAEAKSIDAAIEKICLTQAVDRERIAVAGISAGAGMAALLATLHPARFQAVAMHSGIAPGVAHSSTGAIKAMLGKKGSRSPLPAITPASRLPALLVIHGTADPVVALANGAEAALRWGERAGATAGRPRVVQRGKRYAATITDYRHHGQLIATLCEVSRLGHAWSGGAAGQAYSDPGGPDASRMIWAFAARQFLEIPGPAGKPEVPAKALRDRPLAQPEK